MRHGKWLLIPSPDQVQWINTILFGGCFKSLFAQIKENFFCQDVSITREYFSQYYFYVKTLYIILLSLFSKLFRRILCKSNFLNTSSKSHFKHYPLKNKTFCFRRCNFLCVWSFKTSKNRKGGRYTKKSSHCYALSHTKPF